MFETLKNGIILINILASNNCFGYRNIFQNGLDALLKIIEVFILSKKLKILPNLDYLIMFKFACLWHQPLLRNYK